VALKSSSFSRVLIAFFLSTGFIVQGTHAATCPPLPNLNNKLTTSQWQQIHAQLQPLQSQCLRSSRYYSILGAAQLNLQLNEQALLSLERALLLDETNGEAIIDYSQALFNNGQIFAAIELNDQVLQRADLPPTLSTFVKKRRTAWRQLTRRQYSEMSWHSGYNSNLNNASDLDLLNVTINGQQGVLLLDDNSKVISGAQQRLTFKHDYQQATAQSVSQLTVSLEGRVSRDRTSDQNRASVLYQHSQLSAGHVTTFSAGHDYHNFGGQSLYSDSELAVRYSATENTCQPSVQAAISYRDFHQDSSFNAALLRFNTGISCTLEAGLFKTSVIQTFDQALQQRAGGDRKTWAVQWQWQQPLAKGTFNSALQVGRSQDRKGYSTLLEDNARRSIDQVSVALDYSQPLSKKLAANITFNYNHYKSNIALFRQKNHSLEFGLRYRF
jgi:hypothetical protein